MRIRVLYRMFGCVLLLLAIAGTVCSQEPPQQDQPQEKAKEKSATESRGSRSLTDDALGNLRHQVGFSVGAFEMYQSNLFTSSLNQQTASMTTVTSRVYANFGRRKSKLHFDYGAGYMLYNNRQGLNAFEQNGNGTYNYQLSRKASFNVQDNFSSSPNGYGNFMSSIINPSSSMPSFSTEMLLPRQRITQNNLTANLGFGVGKNQFGVFGGYNLYRFASSNAQNMDGFSVGASYNRQITRWLSLSNSYSQYLNKVDPLFRGARIHRLQVAGLNFKLGSRWEASIGGGVELANTYGRNIVREDASASLTGKSTSHMFSVQYHRGFVSSIGISGLFQSDQGIVIFGSRLTERLSLQLAASYVRGSNFYYFGNRTAGNLNYYSARGGLEYSLFQGLIASGGFTYTNQRARDIIGLPVTLDRYVVYGGVQFVFPYGNR